MLQFKDLRSGNPVYILDRSGDMNISMAHAATDASMPHIDYNSTQMNLQRPNQMIVEVNIDIDGKTQQFVIPEDATVTVTPDNRVIATDIAPIMREVETMRQRSQEILASVEANQQRIKRCDELLEAWNPELRAKRETERRFSGIDQTISELRTDVNDKFDRIMQKLGIAQQPAPHPQTNLPSVPQSGY